MVRRAWLLAAVIPGVLLVACGPPGPAKPADHGGAAAADTAVVVPVPETGATAGAEEAPAAQNGAPSIPFRPMAFAGNVEECIQKLRNNPDGTGTMSQDGGAEYQDGLSAERGGKLPESRKASLRLIQQYPASPFVPGAYFGFGEMFHEEAKTDPSKTVFAEQSYKEVLKYPAPQNQLHAAAQYRLGLTLQKTDATQALGAFARAARVDHESTKEGCAVEIAAAAASASTAAFAEVGDPAKSWDFYLSLTKDGARTAERTLELAQRLVATRKAGDAAVVLAGSVELGARSQPDTAARAAYCKRVRTVADAARAGSPGGAPKLDRALAAACP
jgi:hypothetical protein